MLAVSCVAGMRRDYSAGLCVCCTAPGRSPLFAPNLHVVVWQKCAQFVISEVAMASILDAGRSFGCSCRSLESTKRACTVLIVSLTAVLVQEFPAG